MKQFCLLLFSAAVFSLFSIDAYSQTSNFDADWEKVETFVKKGLPASALEEVKKIYAKARKENQEAQVIKSLIYIYGLQAENRENNERLSIAEIEKEKATASGSHKALLSSLLAGIYWQYYQNNRWQIYGRSSTDEYTPGDIETWTPNNFHQTISSLFTESLKEPELLKKTDLSPFDAIIIKGNVRHLRPTLYDLLAFRALEYFESDEPDISRPAYAFEIRQASAFDPAADFIHRKFDTRDSGSLQHKALLLYQDIIAFHLNDKDPGALIDADIHRYEFVRRVSVHEDKEQLYFNGINHIANQYGNMPAAAQAWYLVASYYAGLGNSYAPFGDTTHRFSRVKAKELCEKILLQKDSSEGKVNAANLLRDLERPVLLVKLEQVNLPNQPFRSLVNYQNLTSIQLRIIRSDDKLRKASENRYNESYWKTILAAPPLRTWQQDLPDTKDLQTHKTEIKIDGLPVGEYFLLASSGTNTDAPSTLIAAHRFYVSSLSYVSSDSNFFVLHRQTGQPISDARIQVWENQYDNNTSRVATVKGPVYGTDANGHFILHPKPVPTLNNFTPHYTYSLEVTTNRDHLFIDNTRTEYYYGGYDEEEEVRNIFLFKDRSIYRPGQTMYFKGIVLSRHTKESTSRLLQQHSTKIFLANANGEYIDSLVMTTNEFGSFHGEFRLPPSGLNGTYSLESENEERLTQFDVEDYKRPRFLVEYEPLKGSYQVNDSITVSGMAKAYAGNNIDGATVQYRVVRQARFLYPWLYARWWQPVSAPLEIVHGETVTDADGKFLIAFTAIPDLKIDPKSEPAFDYVIYADVTDINGETRSSEKTVTVSYKSLLLNNNIPASLPADSLRQLSIRTENNNGEFLPAAVTVKITRLKEEKRLIRSRLWEAPDQFTMNRKEYISLFPYDEYSDETNPQRWEKETLLFEKTDSSRPTGLFPLTGIKPAPGYYIVEISTRDKKGDTIRDQHTMQLTDEKSMRLNSPEYLWTAGSGPVSPGEKARISIGTSAADVFVVQLTDRALPGTKERAASYSYLKLSDQKKTLELPVEETDRGGYGLSWMFVKHNRLYTASQTVKVPWSDKELQIEYISFRDKTLPGSQETWKLKITGQQQDRLAAEILASMYDASLDQFTPHSWQKPDIWPGYYSSRRWDSRQNFQPMTSYQRPFPYEGYKPLIKDYDHFLFSQNGGMTVIGYGRTTKRDVAMRFDSRMEVALDENVDHFSTAVPGSVEGLLAKMPGMQVDESMSLALPLSPDYAFSPGITSGETPPEAVQVRTNFNETAFFFPDLKTDSTGTLEFSFTMPEALTRWKFQVLAHTRDLAFGYSQKEIVTQKQLMVQPNTPRFLREGDRILLDAKMVNLSDSELSGNATLELFNAATNQPVNDVFANQDRIKNFRVPAGQSTVLFFPITVPTSFHEPLGWRIVAKAGAYSDGEENNLPVLSNRMLVTESITLPMKGNGTRNFSFDKLKTSGKSQSLQQHGLTVEYTSNPAWYAVQALPYLMEYPYDCAEQTWNRYYANSLAASIMNASPRLRQVFEEWKGADSTALLSNLAKKQELKSILLEETPWVLDAKTETEQKKQIANLFDLHRMSRELSDAFERISQLQSSNGGFVWFRGGPDDRYMTQYIVTGIGHLMKLNAVAKGQQEKLRTILDDAIPYLDLKLKADYDELIKNNTTLSKYVPDYDKIQYFYMRSFFPEYKLTKAAETAYNYFRNRLPKSWTNQNKYMQGMAALSLYRMGDKKTATAILASLRETAVHHEEMGMYWKDDRQGYWWYEAPVERQALLTEAFLEIENDKKTADELRTWLLKNKQANSWKSTRSTAEACYALLLQGTNWLSNSPTVTIRLGSNTIRSTDQPQEAGTGFFSKTFRGDQVEPGMGDISVNVSSKESESSPGWGAVYWQYFEDMDKISRANTPLILRKNLFVQNNTDRGPVLTPIKEGDQLKKGDKITVRIELTADRDMEYMHLKDMRASSLEPVNVISGYKWQGGLGYYESIRDASANFFFDRLRKGTYVFEYTLFVSHSGSFSNGITTIQSMYAPEFNAHSEGVRINVK